MLDNTTIFVIAALIVGLTIAVIILSTDATVPIGTPPKSAWRNLFDPLRASDPDSVSWWLSFATIVLGGARATPWISTAAQPFGVPDNVMGLLLVAAAVTKYGAMAKDIHRLYSGAVFWEMTIWIALSWAGVQDKPNGWAWLVYAVLATGDVWVLIRLFVDDARLHARAEREARNASAA